MTALVRTLIATHVIVFAAGFVAGKSLDSDELGMYRDLHESTLSRLRRKAGQVGLGALAVGAIVVVIRISSRANRKAN